MVKTAVDIAVLKVGDWVKIEGHDNSPGRIWFIGVDCFSANFIAEEGGEEWCNDLILFKKIEEVITDKKEIRELETAIA